MSSLHILNKSTRNKIGGGLPFYNKTDYIFSFENNCFNNDDGLWTVPDDKIPTFQLCIDQGTLVSIRFRQTYGSNNFVPMTQPNWFYANATLTNGITITGVQINGQQKYIYESSDSVTLAPTVPHAKWIIELVVNDGLEEFTYYSEEFSVKDCC